MSGQKTDVRTRGYVRWACFFLLLSLVMAFFFGLLPVSPLAVATGSMEPSVSVPYSRQAWWSAARIRIGCRWGM